MHLASSVLGASHEGRTKPTARWIKVTEVIRKAWTSKSEFLVLGWCLLLWLPCT